MRRRQLLLLVLLPAIMFPQNEDLQILERGRLAIVECGQTCGPA